MSLNKKKNKKDLLDGAISEELSDGLMSEFINEVNEDKKNEKTSSKKHSESEKSMKELKVAPNASFESYVPMIRNNNFKEWWISLGAFATIMTIVILFFFIPFGANDKFQIHLSSRAISNYNFAADETHDTFELGKPVYVYFTSKKALNSKTINISIINLSGGLSDNQLSSFQSKINPKWKVVETHFQKEFFESPGKYKIIIQNDQKKVLVEKTFSVKD
ncbi:MAG: hypothetical protein OEV66_10285 [Spirochaetia bacterium]|nr:hypothetical protein [Spirochaetia bacterium]